MTELPDEVIKLILCNIGIPRCRNVCPALVSGLLEGDQLGLLDAIALFDETQPFSQHLTGVLIAPRLNQRLHQLVLMRGQNHVVRCHVVGSQVREVARQIAIRTSCQCCSALTGSRHFLAQFAQRGAMRIAPSSRTHWPLR